MTSTSIAPSCYLFSDGGRPVLESGIVYSLVSGPTFNDNKIVIVAIPDATGGYTMNTTITGLTPGNTYYMRSFATNSLGTTFRYGAEVCNSNVRL